MCSATGRGTTRDPKDFYATPWASFKPLLDILPNDPDVYFREPCAGDGRLIKWLRESGRYCDGADLFPQKEAVAEGLYNSTPEDYLSNETHHRFVVTNPPFGVAFEMAQHAKRHADEFIFLLRLSFLESDERGDWLSANEPSALFVLRKRPSFVMACRCNRVLKTSTVQDPAYDGTNAICKHSWLLPIEADRPKECPKCKGGPKTISISTSDNSGYAWFYWGARFKGIHHI